MPALELEGLGSHVTVEMIHGLLQARAPEILDEGTEEFETLVASVKGAVTELVPLVGTDPGEGPRRDLAVRAIAYLTASELEASLFPEQQGPGDLGRAGYLARRYESLRKQLAAMPVDDPNPEGATPALAPTGHFPPASPYPDPVLGPRSRNWQGDPCNW